MFKTWQDDNLHTFSSPQNSFEIWELLFSCFECESNAVLVILFWSVANMGVSYLRNLGCCFSYRSWGKVVFCLCFFTIIFLHWNKFPHLFPFHSVRLHLVQFFLPTSVPVIFVACLQSCMWQYKLISTDSLDNLRAMCSFSTLSFWVLIELIV